ncbi:MAG: BON domain-containing protein [Alphaproteobacteria bacterium]
MSTRRDAPRVAEAMSRKASAAPAPRDVSRLAELMQPSDGDIARAARAALDERLGSVARTIEVRVGNGVVELGGGLESGNQKEIAEVTVGALEGVRSVVNQLRISPPSKLTMRTLYR